MVGFGTRRRDRVGGMRHRAFLQKKVPADPAYDDRGAAQYAWENVYSERVPIEIRQLSAPEIERARQLQSTATHRVRMRYLSGVERQMRFQLDGRQLYVGEIENPEEANRFLILMCEEKRA